MGHEIGYHYENLSDPQTRLPLQGTSGQVTRINRKGREIGDLKLRKTFDIIEAAERGLLPDRIMMNTHPQRWTDNPVEWTKELVWQNVKNVVKRIVVRRLTQI